MKPLPDKMLAVLRELNKPGVTAHYMKYMGRFNPAAYYFLSNTMEHCTAQIRGLIARGLAMTIKETPFGDHQVSISDAGVNFLRRSKEARKK